MPQYEAPTQESREKVLMILFLAYVAMPIVYLIICVLIKLYVFKPRHMGFAPQTTIKYNIIWLILAAISIAEALFITSIRHAIDSGNSFGIVKKFFSAVTKSVKDDMSAISTLNVSVFGLCISVSIYGLVLFLLNGKISDTLVFFILSEILILMFIPGKVFIQKWIIARKNSQQPGN
jgi:hypothetical protein